MADRSKIEWTDATWTPLRARNRASAKVGWHCEHVTAGCEHCYAESINRRLGTGLPFKPGHRKDIELFLDERMLTQPLRWKARKRRGAERPGHKMVFVCSMTDLFADFVPDDWIDGVFAVMALAPQHTFQVLTKRPARMRAYFAGDGTARAREGIVGAAAMKIAPDRGEDVNDPWWDAWWDWPLPNVWLGVSVEDQATADARVPELLATPAAVRWVSYDPALGPVDWSSSLGGTLWIGGQRGHDGTHSHRGDPAGHDHGPGTSWVVGDPRRQHHHHDDRCERGLDWIVMGGESGPGARPMHPDWVRQTRDACDAAGVAFTFKQWGAWLPWSHFHPGIDDDPEVTRYDTREWRDGHWHDVGRPIWSDSVDGTVDNEHCGACVGKKAAGRVLDGRTHDAWPEARS